MPEDFGFDIENAEDVHVVRLRGELDLANGDRLRDALIEVAGSTVVVDLSDLSFMDSSGISALLGARRSIIGSGHGFVVRGANPTVRRVLEVTGLQWLLTD